MDDRSVAEVWHVGVFLAEEMVARGWSPDDVAERMGGDQKARIVNALTVMAIIGDIVLPDDDENEIGPEYAKKLGEAFDVSPEYFLNLERFWREAPATAIRHRR